MTTTSGRDDALDYLKGLFILLMISFHLVYFSEMHPYAKQVVYTFHMPGFLIISGYLMNIGKPLKGFLRTIGTYVLPFLVMESGYIVMASVLPIREHIDSLTVGVFFDTLLLHPIGPYWYLQTLAICGVLYYAVFHWLPLKELSKYIVLALVYYVLADGLGVMSFACSMYFLAGVVLHHSSLSFSDVFQSSSIAIIAFVLLAVNPQNLRKEVIGGVLIVYLAISTALYLVRFIPDRLHKLLLYLGRHTMPLFLFSPIFTFLCKPFAAPLSFDVTGMLFLLLSLVVCVSGSLIIDKIQKSALRVILS